MSADEPEVGQGHLRGDGERRHLGDLVEDAGADIRVDAEEGHAPGPPTKCSTPTSSPAKRKNPCSGRRPDRCRGPGADGAQRDPESVALVHRVVPGHRLEVVLLVDDVHAVAVPGLVLANPAALVLVVPLVVGWIAAEPVAAPDWRSSSSESVASVITSPVPILAASTTARQQVGANCASAIKPVAPDRDLAAVIAW